MATIHGEILTIVFNVPDFGRIGVDAVSGVSDNRVILPTAFPELVADFKILIGDGVALIMFRQSPSTEVPARAF